MSIIYIQLEKLLENVVLLDWEVSKWRFRAVDKFAFGERVQLECHVS